MSIRYLLKMIQNSDVLPAKLVGSINNIWCALDCKTWSNVSGSTYGIHISKEADRDVHALIEICLYYQRLNPNLVITFENPDAHFKEHILAHIWIEEGETFILQL